MGANVHTFDDPCEHGAAADYHARPAARGDFGTVQHQTMCIERCQLAAIFLRHAENVVVTNRFRVG